MKGKYLITADSWFYAPDGNQYKAVWGEVTILQDDILGIKTNAKSSNWYAKIGSEDHHVILAGCQVHYAVRCEKEPNTARITIEEVHQGEISESKAMTRIYLAN